VFIIGQCWAVNQAALRCARYGLELAMSPSEHWFGFGAMLNFFAMQFLEPQDRKGAGALSDYPDPPLRYILRTQCHKAVQTPHSDS
jgi:hypothetical protein